MPKLASGLEQSYHSVELAYNSQEFQDVKIIFESTSSGTIRNYHEIRRIQNPGLYQAYQAKKASMEKTSAHGSNEMSLFHGTDPNTCDQICHFGFNRSFAGRNGKSLPPTFAHFNLYLRVRFYTRFHVFL